MWKDKFGNYLIDISKYVVIGVLISSLIKDLGEDKWIVYAVGIIIAILALIAGLILTNKTK